MSTWAIGDIQGCFATLQRLLVAIDFQPGRDHLWLAGDLVNRGPASLETLRWAMAHDRSVTAVLGNHDLHLLACLRGFRKVKGRDTLQPILDAPDRDALFDWLRHRPLLAWQHPTTPGERGHLMVHAGLAPSWTCELAAELAAEVEATLRGPDPDQLLRHLKGSAPVWKPEITGLQRQLATVAVLTRMRACGPDGAVTPYVGPPESCPEGTRPWYGQRQWQQDDPRVLFGHWAAHGFRVLPNVVSLDSGAVWGQRLTAWRLEDGAVRQVDAGACPTANAAGH